MARRLGGRVLLWVVLERFGGVCGRDGGCEVGVCWAGCLMDVDARLSSCRKGGGGEECFYGPMGNGYWDFVRGVLSEEARVDGGRCGGSLGGKGSGVGRLFSFRGVCFLRLLARVFVGVGSVGGDGRVG